MHDFPDVNVWVALSSQDHPAHKEAKNYFETQAAEKLIFGRVTAVGFVRVICQRHTFGGDALSPVEAWQTYLRWRNRDDVAYANDPSSLDELLGKYVFGGLVTPKNWTDLYLAAFAQGNSMRLVTFDKGFRALTGLHVLILDQPTPVQ